MAQIRLCPSASDRGTLTTLEGNAKAPWTRPGSTDIRFRLGSYAMNGWLYQWNPNGDIAVYYTAADAPKFFQKESNILRPSETPSFFDAMWPDTWPRMESTPTPNLDLALGDRYNALGRCCIGRHPLRGGKVADKQPLPGVINMGFADGHVSNWKLQQIKNVMWHSGYTPTTDPWSTGP